MTSLHSQGGLLYTPVLLRRGYIEGDNDLRFINGNFTWAGGALGGDDVSVANSATLHIQLNATSLNARLQNEGVVNQLTATEIVTASRISNLGKWNLLNNRAVTAPPGMEDEGLPTFVNMPEGILTKHAGPPGGFSTFGVKFDNRGRFDVMGGDVWFLKDARQTDPDEDGKAVTKMWNSRTLKASGAYVVEAGVFSTSANATINGSLTIAGGKFIVGGTGTFGTVTITNNYSQFDGTLEIDVDSAEPFPDRLIVGNTVTLGGTLKVSTRGGGAGSSPLTIITGTRAPATNFANFDFGGVLYTTDLTDQAKYILVPPA